MEIKKSRLFIGILLLLGFSTVAFASDPIGMFGSKFVDIYLQNIAKLIVLGVALFSAYEFYKTKQFTFLIIGMMIAIIVLSAPTIAEKANTDWRLDSNQSSTWGV